ncbi:MAG: DUF4979 domain-containing protein [Muribaculaceae bacterium]|nr:DUF4979 domain-containing protein [Muribaculaceae bacterium]
MKKLYTFLAATLMGAAMVSAANLSVVFDGTDHAGWTVAKNELAIDKGHFFVEMGETNGKYRADIEYKAPAEGDGYTCLRYVAIKFIGQRPQGNMKCEVNAGGWLKKYNADTDKWNDVLNNPDGSIRTTGGNTIYYYDLSKATNFTDPSVFATQINFKVADNTVAPHSYTVDWVKTYATVEAIEADKDWKDDAGDMDEAIVAAEPVVNTTTGTGYTSIYDAVAAATEGDELVVNEPQILSAGRLNINASIVVKAGKDGVIKRGKNELSILMNAKNKVTFEGLTFDGVDLDANKYFMEVSAGGTEVTFKNVTFTNFSAAQRTVQVKGGGKVTIDGAQAESCSTDGDFFIGSNGSVLTGDNSVSVYLEKENTINATELTNTTPIVLFFDTTRAQKVLVYGWDNADNFASGVAGYKPVANEGNIEFTISTGVDSVVAADEALVNVYNLQGVLLRSGVEASVATEGLPAGLYIAGGKKVMVK